MTLNDWPAKHTALIRILRERMGSKETPLDVIDGYEEVMRSIWSFTSQFVGDAGTRAVLARSIRLAALDTPLLHVVKARERQLDFGELREHTTTLGCGTRDVLDALLHLGVMTFCTLNDLSDDAITGPLLSRLEEKR